MRYINYVLFGVLAIALVSPIAVRAIPRSFYTDEMIARSQVNLCKDAEGEEEKELCYQKHVPQLMDEGLSLERAFNVLRRVLILDRGYQSCHVLAHVLSSREVAKDPAAWKDVITRVPLDICGSGAVHGAFQERFRTESMPDASADELGMILDGACDARGSWNPTPLDRSSCMHGMGHLLLYVTDANVKKSVELCRIIGKRGNDNFQGTCTEGIFMQLYQPMEPEDETLIRNIATAAHDSETYCKQFTGIARRSCVKESWPAVENSATNPVIFEALCNRLTDRDDVRYCANGEMYAVIEMLRYDVPVVEDFCRGLKAQDLKNICWSRLASKFIWADHSHTDQALAICRAAPEESKDACWTELLNFAYGGLPKGSRDVRALCSGLPEPYGSQCTEGTGV